MINSHSLLARAWFYSKYQQRRQKSSLVLSATTENKKKYYSDKCSSHLLYLLVVHASLPWTIGACIGRGRVHPLLAQEGGGAKCGGGV